MINCSFCGSPNIRKNGKMHNHKTKEVYQKYHCLSCNRYPNEVISDDTIKETLKNFEISDIKTSSLSELELRKRYDVKYIVSEAVVKLEKGVFVPEPEFIKSLKLKGSSGYRHILEADAFSTYKGRAGGIYYWSHPESIVKMKNEGILT